MAHDLQLRELQRAFGISRSRSSWRAEAGVRCALACLQRAVFESRASVTSARALLTWHVQYCATRLLNSDALDLRAAVASLTMEFPATAACSTAAEESDFALRAAECRALSRVAQAWERKRDSAMRSALQTMRSRCEAARRAAVAATIEEVRTALGLQRQAKRG